MNRKIPKNKIKFILLATCYLLLATFFLTGCATTSKPAIFREVTIKGKTYIPILSLCQQYEIDWNWDSFGRIISLKKLDKEIRALVGSTMIIINGRPKKMALAPQFYKGVIVVPVEFEEEIKSLVKDE